MSSINRQRQKKIWFRRWTNKSWAVFASLKAVVHILHLKKTICCQSILKQDGMTRLVLTNDFLLKEVIPALRDSDNEPPSGEELLNLLFQSHVNQLTRETAGKHLPFLLNHHIPCRFIIPDSAGDLYFT